MPKRIPTPPPPDNEPKYLTIAYPYPMHANMERDEERKELAFWLACCVGKENLFAICHKPSARNMVIVEINRELQDFTVVLGAHKWNEFLKQPRSDEAPRISKIFYCGLSDGRKVQKYGWKRVPVEESWFHDWSPQNPYIIYPYPKTHYCEPPPEDMTTYKLCRPLPVAAFPPPPSERLPPVGSPEWLKYKQIQNIDPKVAWRKNTAINAKVGGNPGTSASGANSAGPMKPQPRPDRPAQNWHNPSPASGSNNPTANSTNSGTIQEMSWGPGWSTVASNPVPANPPGLPVPSGDLPRNDETLYPLLDTRNGTLPQGGDPGYENDEDDDEDGPWGAAFVPVDDAVQKEEVNLWEGHDAPQGNFEPMEEIICPTHGVVCRRGICADYSRLKRQKDRERQLKEKEREKENARQSWRSRGGGKGRGNARGDSSTRTNAPREKPAHLAPRPKPAHLLPREKPAHLQRPPSAAPPSQAPALEIPATKSALVDLEVKQSWADLMDEEDMKSHADSTEGGWGNISEGPW